MRMRVGVMVGCISSTLWVGCPATELSPIEPCTVSGVDNEVALQPVDKVDLLFVIDDSQSMRAEQEKLRQQLPRLVESLATGHLDDDGVQDFPAVSDLHLGVISTDMGALNADRGACATSSDGVLLASPDRCGAVTGDGAFLAFAPGPETADRAASGQALGQQFGCLAELGIEGCGHEQPLEAALKALLPSSSTTQFSRGSVGHGDGLNAGFLRPDSVIAVIVVSDEDDCSHPDSSAFLTETDKLVNVKCGLNPDAVHPTSRFVQGLRSLRPENPENVIFGAIVGVPLEASGQAAAEIAALPQMQFRTMIGEGGAEVAADVCTARNAEAGSASAALRIVDVARQFGEQSTVHSICADDYRPALDAILRKIGEQLEVGCLQRPLERSGGRVPCEVTETMKPGEPCDLEKGRTLVGVEQGREICVVQQLDVVQGAIAEGVGWYYDDFSTDAAAACGTGMQLAFSAGAEPRGEAVRFECLQSLRAPGLGSTGKSAIGVPCPTQGCAALNDETSSLFCAEDATCQQTCAIDDDCANGWVCDAPLDESGQPTAPRCVNPRC